MNAIVHSLPSRDVFPFDLRWNSQDLADAVPLRLCELLDFSAEAAPVANAATLRPRNAHAPSYLPASPLSGNFRVR